jgi:hypothetical protein
MAKLTRRGFLEQTTVGVATLGVLTTVPGLAAVSEAPEDVATELSTSALPEAMVAHVRDLATGEISLLVGNQEIIYRDPELVMRLLRAAR